MVIVLLADVTCIFAVWARSSLSAYLLPTTVECLSAITLLSWTIRVIILSLYYRCERQLSEIGPNISPPFFFPLRKANMREGFALYFSQTV